MKVSSRKSADHVVFGAENGGTFRCRRCSETYRPQLPAPITMVSAMAKAFIEMHQDCEEWPESESVLEKDT